MRYKVMSVVKFYDNSLLNEQLVDVMNEAKEELEQQLTNAIDEGWTTQGGVSVSITEHHLILTQAVIK